jgi:hypothetical protein
VSNILELNDNNKTYVESGDFFEEFALVLHGLPEQDEVTLLENVGDVDNLFHGVVAHLSRQ